MSRKILNKILIVIGIIGGAFIVVIIGMLISIFIIEGTDDYSRAQVSGSPVPVSGYVADNVCSA